VGGLFEKGKFLFEKGVFLFEKGLAGKGLNMGGAEDLTQLNSCSFHSTLLTPT
jgi:hypothetical protein